MDINKKAAKAKNINQSPTVGRPKTDARSPFFGHYGAPNAQNPRPTIGAMEDAPIGKSNIPPGSSASTSFLDGYFLKSLHEERMGRKISRDEAETKDNFQQKSQKRNVRDNTLK